MLEVTASAGTIPAAKTRAAVHKEIAGVHQENLLIFINAGRNESLWYWVKRDDGKSYPRDHYFEIHQPGDLFLSKLSALVFEIGELDPTGDIPVLEVAKRLREALDIERVTKKFYDEFQAQHLAFIELIRGIANERDRRWYASVLLNRLMFIYFLQKKGFLDNNDQDYLQTSSKRPQRQGRDLFYTDFLKLLFFEGFAKTEDQRSAEAARSLGKIRYLNGGLFLPHKVEIENPEYRHSRQGLRKHLRPFPPLLLEPERRARRGRRRDQSRRSGLHLREIHQPEGIRRLLHPPEITEYLCERTIHRLILEKVPAARRSPDRKAATTPSITDLLMDLDNDLCRVLIHEVLPNSQLLDPACGSGAFLVAAMKTLINIYWSGGRQDQVRHQR